MKERADCFAFTVFQMSCYCKYFVALPHGAMGCLHCVILVFPDHTHLHFAYQTIGIEYYNISQTKFDTRMREHSGSVEECFTRDGGAAGSCLTGVTASWSLSKTHLSWLSTGPT